MPDKIIYRELDEHQGIPVRVSLHYWIQNRRNPGFYLSAVPVEFKGEFESGLVSEVQSELVLSCNRYSANRETEARTAADGRRAALVAQVVASKLGKPAPEPSG